MVNSKRMPRRRHAAELTRIFYVATTVRVDGRSGRSLEGSMSAFAVIA